MSLANFSLILQEANDIESGRIRQVNFLKKGQKLQPFIIAVGANNTAISSGIVCVDTIKYIFTDIKTALDTCFQSIFALNSAYPPHAYNVWLFVQQALYDLKTPNDKVVAQVCTLVGNFKTLLNLQRAALEAGEDSD